VLMRRELLSLAGPMYNNYEVAPESDGTWRTSACKGLNW
jgi:hypothetical protein